MDEAAPNGPPPAAARNLLLVAQWDGTDFAGWQHQPNQRTVQSTLTTALETMVHHPVDLFASSRTDSGVHARAMPIAFVTTRPIPPENFLKGLSTLLPNDLSVLEVREVPLAWRPRDQAVAKTYTYRLQLGARRPLHARAAWWLGWRRVDLDRMRAGAAHFLGEHDFSAFRSAHCDSRSTTRRMYRIDVSEPDADEVVAIEVTGNAFLRNMVRIMIGTLVDVAFGRREPAWVAERLSQGDRTLSGQTAPAHGLTLTTVHFEGYPRLGKVPPPPSEGARVAFRKAGEAKPSRSEERDTSLAPRSEVMGDEGE
ncbi:MAG: tRNA pseudouridine(38-40) synthase TruA [Deltaproteobacteria bacterium]|nr:tRNA pseudouridine(38-40) synthase TruA [Deltaproteobacteria bacterium]